MDEKLVMAHIERLDKMERELRRIYWSNAWSNIWLLVITLSLAGDAIVTTIASLILLVLGK